MELIEQLSFEEIFSRMKEELVRRDPDFTALVESDPAIMVLQTAASRELFIRQRINEAAKSNVLKFATGKNLDNLAEFYGVERQEGEDDKRFRKRIKAKIAGTGGNYRYHALSSDVRVKDALVESPVPGNVRISVLSTELSTESEELINIVREKVNQDNIRVLTDTIEVVGCKIIEIDIHSRISARSPDVIEQAKKKFIEKFESAKRLGWSVTRSWIIANLFVEGVENVELIEPKEDVVVLGNQCAVLKNFNVELN